MCITQDHRLHRTMDSKELFAHENIAREPFAAVRIILNAKNIVSSKRDTPARRDIPARREHAHRPL